MVEVGTYSVLPNPCMKLQEEGQVGDISMQDCAAQIDSSGRSPGGVYRLQT